MNTTAEPFLALLGPLGGPELIVIFLVILLLFGAKKIPELARGVGKGMGEFKKAKEDFELAKKLGKKSGIRNPRTTKRKHILQQSRIDHLSIEINLL